MPLSLEIVAICLAIGAGLHAPASKEPARKPNVIVFLADDLGSADLGCVGCKDIRTPHIDALAARGVRFTSAYVAASVCSPSRAAILTGRNCHKAGVPSNVSADPSKNHGLAPSEVTFAELVKPLGYRTALLGKWHQGVTADKLPNQQGFDRFFGFRNGCINYFTHIFTFEEPKGHDLWRDATEVKEDGSYFTDLVTREAKQFLQENKEQPFLLYVPFNAPHYPMQAPVKWFEEYSELPADRQAYAAMVSAMDDSIGQILGQLTSLGMADDTLVFFLSDHGATVEKRAGGGAGSNAPFRGFKFSLFDGGTRVPLIVSWPRKLPKGMVCDQLCSSMDLFPTIARATGASLPEGVDLDGHDLLPLALENASSKHEALCWSQGGAMAVRKGKWKLVVESAPSGKPPGAWLSDVSTDPGETKNLASEQPMVVAELTAVHKRWAEANSSGAVLKKAE